MIEDHHIDFIALLSPYLIVDDIFCTVFYSGMPIRYLICYAHFLSFHCLFWVLWLNTLHKLLLRV